MNENQNNSNDELKELSSFLSKLPKSKKQEVLPKDYFQNFEARLMNRINEEEALKPKTIETKTTSWWDKISTIFIPKYAFGFASVIILIVSVFFVLNDNNATQEDLLAELSQEEATTYIVNNIEDFSTEEIIASLELNEIKKIETITIIKPTIENKTTEPSSSKTAMEKAIEQAGGERILEDLKAEDIEEELEGLF